MDHANQVLAQDRALAVLVVKMAGRTHKDRVVTDSVELRLTVVALMDVGASTDETKETGKVADKVTDSFPAAERLMVSFPAAEQLTVNFPDKATA